MTASEGRGGAILVTGGAGFIGSALVRRLLAAAEGLVVTADKLTYAGHLASLGEALDHPRHRFHRVDVADAPALRRLFDEYRPRAVLHLAAESHVDRSIDGPADFVRTNLVGTYALLEEARRHWAGLAAAERERFRFVHVSTDEVFGSLGTEGRFDESSPYAPSSPYAATKAGSDHLARAWHRTYGLPVVVTNCSNNYGPRQYPEKLIPLTIHRALAGMPVPVYGTGENVRDWLHVEDHAEGLRLALERGAPGETYLFGGGAERRNLEVVEAICDALDELVPDPSRGPRRGLIRFVEDRPGHDHRYAVDDASARRSLGWSPAIPFGEGLRATVRWYLEHADWRERVLAGRYGGERLGLGPAGEALPEVSAG